MFNFRPRPKKRHRDWHRCYECFAQIPPHASDSSLRCAKCYIAWAQRIAANQLHTPHFRD